jgi:methanogenic corrinoid protein MtbC1
VNVTLSQPSLRIGEFSRRVGVDADVLRSWERRYGLSASARTAGGLRLYGPADEARVRRMLAHMASGLSAGEAARLTLAADRALGANAPVPPATSPAAPSPASLAETSRFWDGLDRFNEGQANAAFDRLLGTFSLATIIREAVLPYLRHLGVRWREQGDAVIPQEHFATAVLRGRLLGLARGWGAGAGPSALLACLPGDFHDLALICFGLALREHGWRITFLGANTPYESIRATITELEPQLTVLTRTAAVEPRDPEDVVAAIAKGGPLALAGPGIDPELARSTGVELLREDPFTAAERIAVRYAQAAA